jgi:hypothetical protein
MRSDAKDVGIGKAVPLARCENRDASLGRLPDPPVHSQDLAPRGKLAHCFTREPSPATADHDFKRHLSKGHPVSTMRALTTRHECRGESRYSGSLQHRGNASITPPPNTAWMGEEQRQNCCRGRLLNFERPVLALPREVCASSGL